MEESKMQDILLAKQMMGTLRVIIEQRYRVNPNDPIIECHRETLNELSVQHRKDLYGN